MPISVLAPTVPPNTVIGKDQILTFDVRSEEELSLLVLSSAFPRVLPHELIYAADPNTDTEFQGAYNYGSSITPVSDPGFFRWRFALKRKPGWIGNPIITAYSAGSVEMIGPTGPTGPA